MTKEELLAAFSEIDERYIAEAANANGAARRLRRITAIAACLCLCFAAAFVWRQVAQPVIIEENGFYIEDGVLLSYSGSDTDIVLPEVVTEVADYAFEAAPAVESITLSASVEKVNVNSFAGLANLAALVLADESTAFVEHDGAILTFDGSMIVYYQGDAPSYTVPDGVKYIAAHAFQNTAIASVDFGDELEYIGCYAFAGCHSLQAIHLPESIIRVDKGAFAGCIKAVEGTIPDHIDMDDSSFEHVPFYLSLLAGHISPLEEIARGQITPSEAITKSEQPNFGEQIDAILHYYRTGSYMPNPENKAHLVRTEHILSMELPEEAVIPETWTPDDLTYNDNGWGGMGIRDVQIRLPLGNRCTLVMEAYLYGGGMDILDWRDGEWRIEQILLVREDAEPDYGDWQVTLEQDHTLTFYNTVTGAAVNSPILQGQATEYRLTFSPGETRCAVEYDQPIYGWRFFVLPLNGDKLGVTWYADYMNTYFGQYTKGSLSWIDEDTLRGENVYGEFEWNIHEIFPRQINDPYADLDESIVKTVTFGKYNRGDHTDVYTMCVPERWVGERYMEDAARKATHPGNATRMTGYQALYDASELYNGGWDAEALSQKGLTVNTDEVLLINNEKYFVIKHVLYEYVSEFSTKEPKVFATVYSAAILLGNSAAIVEFWTYPEDAEDYFERVIQPVIESFALTQVQNKICTIHTSIRTGEGEIDCLVQGEQIFFENGKTWLELTITPAGSYTVANLVDVSAIFPYDSAREGKALRPSEAHGGFGFSAERQADGKVFAELTYNVWKANGEKVSCIWQIQDALGMAGEWTLCEK